MTEKRFRVNDLMKFNYSEIGEYVDENHTDRPLRNDEVVDLLNEQQATIKSKDKQLERLYNYFQDYLKDEMSGNAFSEMWDFVKEDESWEDE